MAKVPGVSKSMGRARGSSGMVGYLQRRGTTRGVMGGSRGWLYFAVGMWVFRRVRVALRGGPARVLISEALAPGDRIVIANGRATLDLPRRSQVQSKG